MREKHTEPLLGDLALFSWQAVNWRAPDWECRSGNNLVTLSCFLRRWKKLPVFLNSLTLENYSWSEKLRQKCEQKISRTRSLNNQHINSKSSGWTSRESNDEPNEWSGHSYGDRIITNQFLLKNTKRAFDRRSMHINETPVDWVMSAVTTLAEVFFREQTKQFYTDNQKHCIWTGEVLNSIHCMCIQK